MTSPVAADAVMGCGGGTAAGGTGAPASETIGSPGAGVDSGGLPAGPNGMPLRAVAVEGEWRTWRGNEARSGTRLARGISTPEIAWHSRVGIQGYANTPLVSSDAVFVSSQGAEWNVPDAEDGFLRLERATGRRIWFAATSEDVNGATLTEELVIGGTDSGELIAVERDGGNVRWTVDVGFPVHHGPLQLGSELWLSGGAGVTLISIADGRVVRTLPGRPDEWDPRGSLATDGERVYRSGYDGWVEAFSPEGLVWERRLIDTGPWNGGLWTSRQSFGPPAVVGSALIALTPENVDYQIADLRLAALDGPSGAVLWSIDPEVGFGRVEGEPEPYLDYYQAYQLALPWLMNGMLFYPQVTSHDLVAFDLATGQPVQSLPMDDCRMRQFAAIVGVPSRGYFARHDGWLHAFTPATGDGAWRVYLGVESQAGGNAPGMSVSLAPGDYYGESMEYCSGYPMDGTALFATPAVDEAGWVYVGSGDGWMYALRDGQWEE